jgi:hypothetical protein
MSDVSVMFGRPPRASGGDDRFDVEVIALEELEIESYAIPLDPIVLGDVERALRKLPPPANRTWLYRGWMLREDEYSALYEAILDRDEELVVDPESFAEATYAPRYLPLLGEHTAPARWTESDDIDEAWEAAQELGSPPWIVKDWVKSAKEEWHRACFVPEGADRADFGATCERLLEIRGEAFETGFVVKKYLHILDEFRLLFWNGELVAHAPYHDDDVDSVLDDPSRFAFLGGLVSSPFFTADVARLASGGFTVIEINDGGSSAFPERLDPRGFYRAIR